MPLGHRALNPETRYLIYEFSYNKKVFYIGIAAEGRTRHTHRWSFVANLVRHEQAGTLKPIKARALNQKSNAVLAALIRAGYPQHQWLVAWSGKGKKAAELEETAQIKRRLDEGCVLANVQHNPNHASTTIADILGYLGVDEPIGSRVRRPRTP